MPVNSNIFMISFLMCVNRQLDRYTYIDIGIQNIPEDNYIRRCLHLVSMSRRFDMGSICKAPMITSTFQIGVFVQDVSTVRYIWLVLY